MKPLLSVFLDGLKPESLKHMPFVNSFCHKSRIKGEFGYSIACHGSMYSGVHTNKHKLWFVWKKSPETSPFKKIKLLANLPLSNTLPAKLFLHKLAVKLSDKNTSFFGIPRVVNVPSSFISELDVTEKKCYNEEGYIEDYPSLFDILRRKNIDFHVVGMDKSEKEESKILERTVKFKKVPWLYWFIGDVDHFSHEFGQDSNESIKRLNNLDRLLEYKYNQLVKQIGAVDFMLWSDHGHIDVETKIDLYKIFNNSKLNLDNFNHVIDSTYVRFWCSSTKEKVFLSNFLSKNLGDWGFIMDKEMQIKNNVYPGDNRFGDIIFALSPGFIFSKTIWGYSRKMKSMHGYDSNDYRSDGVIVSNLKFNNLNRKPELIDISPSILNRLGIEKPEYMEGKVLL